MLRPADIWRLHPDEYEFLWRSILRQEHGDAYRRLDGHGIDCMANDTAYQIYSHQSGAWAAVQAKFRHDLEAAQQALASGELVFERWVFVSTFPFKDPAHAKWLEEQKAAALPLIVQTWGDEALLADPARQAAVERVVGQIKQVASFAVQVTGAGLVAIGQGGGHGIHIEPGGVTIQNSPRIRPLVGVPCTFNGRTFFLAWDGDLDHLPVEDPRDVTGDEIVAIQCAICRYQSDPQQPIWARVQGSGRREVWEVDEHPPRRRKLRSALLRHEVSFLTVGDRRETTCLGFCARCGRTSSGNNCTPCGVPLRHCP